MQKKRKNRENAKNATKKTAAVLPHGRLRPPAARRVKVKIGPSSPTQYKSNTSLCKFMHRNMIQYKYKYIQITEIAIQTDRKEVEPSSGA